MYVPAGPQRLDLSRARKPRVRKSANPVAAYRRVARAGAILFTGAFVWVAAAFVATVYAWRRL